MDRKRELKQMYKETAIQAGVYQITNAINNKTFVGSTRNLKTLNGLKFSLETGVSTNKQLQEEWRHYGKDAFHIEVLEILKKKDTPYFNEKEALAELEEKWLDQLKPFGEKGYNRQ
ncbi:GIY-YIG nuclease family protein [Mesobacillus foraminis]|uniref:GIY-YIG nuclease family protein n=1 Tax=Mesobacillus foraminis TaxID=279826 RepID=UPI000EF5574A|nr:GIY-YIG nuclease family protein [Mesobacillus foraminis]